MSLKLRELIKKVRSCKTAEEERSIMNKESAEIRNLGKDQSDVIKCRNLLKCVYMHMMGIFLITKVILPISSI
jgi:AP-1 complex subunit gamma-1